MTTTPSTREAGAETGPRVHTTTHSVLLTVDPRAAYEVIADVSRWPYTFSPTVHVERDDAPDAAPGAGGRAERLHLWAFAHGDVRNWTSLRHLDPTALTIDFRQERSPSPLASMGGRWTVSPDSDGTCRVVLDHDFTLLEEDEEAERLVRTAVDTNSRAELDSLAAATADERAETVVSFSDTVVTEGSADAVYAFLRDAAAWPERLPHVSRLELTEPEPDVQVMEMDTRPPGGEVHTTASVRVCLPPGDIVYKQTTVPPVFAAHTGRWTVRTTDGGTEIVSHHTVVLRPDRITDALGPDATLADARTATRDTLGANSRTTLERAAAFATARAR